MATILWSSSMGFHGKVTDFIDFSSLFVSYADTASIVVSDRSGGDGFVVNGDFTYTGRDLTGGTITAFSFFDQTPTSSTALLSVFGLSISAATAYQAFLTGGGAAVQALVFAGNDIIAGSDIGDRLLGGAGRDRIGGGGGADILVGQKGNDILTGDRGVDTFVFAARDGHDRITDFHDNNLRASDDKIAISHAMYDRMVATDTATGVLLDFGTAGSIAVDKWHVAQMDTADFAFL